MTMVRSILPLAVAAATLAATALVADARTTVAVLEVGQGGVVRRTTTAAPHASVHGVASFFNAVHDKVDGKKSRRSAQHPGMAMVPDLFSRADGGVVLGLMGSAVDLADMPHLSSLLKSETTVGTFELAGSHAPTLLKKAGGSKTDSVVTSAADVASSLKSKASSATNNQLQSLSVTVNDEADASKVDFGIAAVVSALQKESAEAGKTLLLHLVIDQEESGPIVKEQLEQQQQQQQSESSESGTPHGRRLEDQQNNNNNNNWNVQYSSSSGYGERTIFEIQYFNVVLWSAIGLLVILLTAIYMMVSMPLMADTLLFGESAKMVTE